MKWFYHGEYVIRNLHAMCYNMNVICLTNKVYIFFTLVSFFFIQRYMIRFWFFSLLIWAPKINLCIKSIIKSTQWCVFNWFALLIANQWWIWMLIYSGYLLTTHAWIYISCKLVSHSDNSETGSLSTCPCHHFHKLIYASASNDAN